MGILSQISTRFLVRLLARRKTWKSVGMLIVVLVPKWRQKVHISMALSAVYLTVIFSATWSPSGDLGPRSKPIRSIFAVVIPLLPSPVVVQVSVTGRFFGWHCECTVPALGIRCPAQRVTVVAGRLRNTICGWSSLLICVSWGAICPAAECSFVSWKFSDRDLLCSG